MADNGAAPIPVAFSPCRDEASIESLLRQVNLPVELQPLLDSTCEWCGALQPRDPCGIRAPPMFEWHDGRDLWKKKYCEQCEANCKQCVSCGWWKWKWRMEKVPDTWVQPGDQISLVTYSEDIWICNDCDISVPEAQVLGIGPALWYERSTFLEQPLQPAEIINGLFLGDHGKKA